jgi:hypothetical protein
MLETLLNDKYGKFITNLWISERPESIRISAIVLNNDVRNIGIGSKIMNDIVDYCDQNNKTATLTPSSDFGGNKRRLISFYKRFGFVSNRNKNKDFRFSDTMIRTPKSLDEDKITGGLTDDKTVSSIAKKHEVKITHIIKQIRKGVKIEMEHTNSPTIAKEIAKDHLWEDPNYYTKLDKMEKQGFQEILKKRLNQLVGEDYPASFNMEEFKKLNSFASRVRYCEQHLQRISSGSSRIVYKIDEEKVLKLAKNKKGLAQNETEIGMSKDFYFNHLFAHVFDFHQDDLWLEMELAKKVSPSTFRQIIGFDIKDLYTYLFKQWNENNGRKMGDTLPPEKKEMFSESQFAQDMLELVMNYDTNPGDFGRLSSYGLVTRNGQPDIVLIDYGLTGAVYDSYYS